MSKAGVSAALLAHYGSGAMTLATLWKITRRDGVVYAFTDHDTSIMFEGLTYLTTSSYDAGAVQTRMALGVDDVQLVGLLGISAITAASIEQGLWDKAQVEIAEVNYRDLTMGANVMRYGEIGEIQRNGQQFTAELRGLLQYLQNNIGRIVMPNCDADFGDTRCKYPRETLRRTGTVGVVTSQRIFVASYVGAPLPIATYGIGEVTWVTGPNAGLKMEMKSFALDGTHTLQLDMPFPIALDNTFTIVPGCNKIGRLGDCKLVYSNYINFRGYEDLPGQNKTQLVGGQ